MDAHSEIAESRPPGVEPLLLSDEGLWHGGWALGAVVTAAGVLAAVGAVSARVLLALLFMALPGITGAIWRPGAQERFALLALWSLCGAMGACVTGGLSGPLAVLCVTPVLACMAIGGSWRAGAGLAVAAVVLCAVVGVLHLLPKLPAEPGRTWLTLIALLVTVAAAGGALLVSHRRAEDERDEVEAELSAFQALMGDLPELALALDPEGRTEALFGQPLEGLDLDALHAGLTDAAHPADRSKLQAAMERALDQGSAQATFASLSAPDQRIAVSLQKTATGGLTAILRKSPPPSSPPPRFSPVAAAATGVVSTEVAERLAAAETGRREAELGRDRAEAVATARARFLANMSHELRTPLNAIMGFSDMMRAKMFGELPPKYAEYAELIHESGGHLLDLINDVLDMSKIEAQRYTLSREAFDVRDALNAALRLMRLQADDAGVKLRAVLPPEPLMIDADKRAVKQIALNLLSNALKFTPRDGAVILSAKAVAGVLELVVADTGMGIAEDDLKRLGQPFEQAGASQDRARGTGLGLSLVDAFAKLHGGTLSLESRLGEGTAATVRMPVLAAAASSVEATSSATPVPEPQPVEAEAAEPPPVESEAVVPPPAPQTLESEPVEPNVDQAPPPPIEAAQPAPPAPQSEEPPAEAEPAEPASIEEEAPEPAQVAAPPNNLGPLDSRSGDHHGLRQTFLNIFSPRTAKPHPEPPPNDPNRPNNSGVRILS